MVGFNFAPRGWALCDGQLVQISQYQALYSLLGVTYGGDGVSTFGLPDLRGRVPVHQGVGPGLSPRPMGQMGGVEQVTLIDAEVSSHSHVVQAVSGEGNSESPEGQVWAEATDGVMTYVNAAPEGGVTMNGDAIQPAGGGRQPHNNVQPFLCINYVISLAGMYPPRP
jgi:microcystin-dependent protein